LATPESSSTGATAGAAGDVCVMVSCKKGLQPKPQAKTND